MKPAHTTKRHYLLLLAAVIVGGALGIAFDREVLAQQSGITRTILLRTDEPGAPNYEAVMGVAELAPGASSGRHRHYGIEIGYVLEGTVVVTHEGRPTVSLRPGEAFRMDGPHEASNQSDDRTRILAVYLVEKGKPLAEPVP